MNAYTRITCPHCGKGGTGPHAANCKLVLDLLKLLSK